MQAHHQPRLRKTPFGDTTAPNPSRYARADFTSRVPSDERPPYEVFSLQPAIDGLGTAGATEKPARN